MRTAIVMLLLLTTAACSPAQRAVVGGSIAAAGLSASYVAVDSMAGACREHDGPRQVCLTAGAPTSPLVGVPVALGGLGIAFLGVVIATKPARHAPRPRTDTPAPPAASETPIALDENEAVGMALARLAVEGFDIRRAPPELLDVDRSQSRLDVQGSHAQLWNLYVLTTASESWMTIDAAFQYDSGWKLTSVGKTPGTRL